MFTTVAIFLLLLLGLVLILLPLNRLRELRRTIDALTERIAALERKSQGSETPAASERTAIPPSPRCGAAEGLADASPRRAEARSSGCEHSAAASATVTASSSAGNVVQLGSVHGSEVVRLAGRARSFSRRRFHGQILLREQSDHATRPDRDRRNGRPGFGRHGLVAGARSLPGHGPESLRHRHRHPLRRSFCGAFLLRAHFPNDGVFRHVRGHALFVSPRGESRARRSSSFSDC